MSLTVPFASTRPRSTMATLVHSSSSSGRMWLLMRIVLPSDRSSRRSSRSSTRARGSRPDAGSSRSRTCGSWTRAWARHRRCSMPAREGLDVVVAAVGEVDELQQVADRPASLRRRQPVAASEEVQVLPDLHVVVDPEDVRHEPEDAPDLVGVPRDRPAGDLRDTGRGLQERGQDPERRRFPGAVRSDEPEDLAVLDVEVHAGDGDGRRVALDEALGADDDAHSHGPPDRRGSR